MEIRMLTAEAERRIFAEELVKTRMTKGAGFSETECSRVGQAHLAFGRLFGVYDDSGATPEEMLAGFVLHDLGSFPQSYPRPDLTYLPPASVFECGELWAKAAGAANVARQGIWIMLGLLGAKALLAYPILKPWNLTLAYRKHFEWVGEPIEWPYARTIDGNRIFVQAIVSEGENLRCLVQEGGQYGFQASANLECVRFNSPHRIFRRSAPGSRMKPGSSASSPAVVQFDHMPA